MGNAQSAPTPREQYRLSKPKTNASSNLLALAHPQTEQDTLLTPPKTSNIDETEAVVTSPSGERRSRPAARPKLRAHLFGSTGGSTRTEPPEGDFERRCGLGELVSGVRVRLSRSGSPGSPGSQPSSGRASSTNLANPLGASHLSLVHQSSTPDAEETRRLYQDIRARASTDELAAFSHISSPVDEIAPNNPVLSPIRRRSLLTPGIATRVPDDILRKPPPRSKLQSHLDRAYYYNPPPSESLPLARLAVLDLANHGRVSPVARTATPTFHDYGHLGGLKLGTLRITNGTASPAPSDCTVHLGNGQSLAHSDVEGDYFAFSGRCKPEVREDGDAPRDPHWQRGQSLPATSYLFSAGKGAVGPGRVSDSALDVNGSATLRSSRWYDEISKANALVQVDVPTESIRRSHSRKQRSMSLYGTSDDFPDAASSIAQEYITELPCSPFLLTDPHIQGSLKVLSTTKANEFEDNLFEDESSLFSTQAPSPRKPKWSLAVEEAGSEDTPGGSREDALRILDGRTTSTLEQGSCQNLSPGSSEEHGRVSSPNQSEKAPSKADSGYSSNASLQSLKQEQGLETVSGMETTHSTSTLTVRPYLSPPKRAPPPPPPPSEESNAAATIRSVAYSQTSSAGGPLTLGALNVVNESDNHHRYSQTTPASPAMAPQQDTTSLPIAVSQRKLKKERPLSQPLPVKCITVQGYRELSQSYIPPIPTDVAAKHAQRQRSFPLLEHTFPSLQHTNLRDELTAVPPVSIPIRFPSPSKTLEEATFQVKQQSSPTHTKSSGNHDRPSHTNRSSVNWIKCKRRYSRESVSYNDDLPEIITNLGTVTDTLGGSPYDIARSTLAGTSRPSDGQTQTRSHHTNDDYLKEKATGMDEEAAARFARSRSKSRSQGQLRSRTPSNSRFNDRGGIPGKTLRPKSVIIDAPPVPALPSMGDFQLGKAGPEKSKSERPVSAPLGEPPVIIVSGVTDATVPIDNHPPLIKYDKSWEEHRRTWVQRRRSAAEGLLSRGQTLQDTEAISGPGERVMVTSARPLASAKLDMGAVYRDPSSSREGTTRFQKTSTVAVPSAKNSHGKAATARPSFEYIAGRYTGGLSYGYEPGYGLGGSAGTRNTKTGASRKSVDVSRGFGIDLSDVPIFIAKTVDC